MKKLYLKFLWFGLSYVILCIIIDLFVPYYYGNPWFASKVNYLEELQQPTGYNTFFFGSSRIYSNVNPLVFDSVCQSNGLNVKSFNLGANITFPPQSYYLYEQFLQSKESVGMKYAFLELAEFDVINERAHNELTTYHLRFQDLVLVWRSVLTNYHLPRSLQAKYCFRYGVAYFERIFHLGYFGQSLLLPDFRQSRYVGPDGTGFFSLDDDLASSGDAFLQQRYDELQNDSSLIGKRISVISRCFNTPTNFIDQVHLSKINELIRHSEARNVKLIFILEPRVGTKSLIDLFYAIPEDHRVQLCNPMEFPEFYTLASSFDSGHLNKAGSHQHSVRLADLFNQVMSN